jgi:hypothetical protein
MWPPRPATLRGLAQQIQALTTEEHQQQQQITAVLKNPRPATAATPRHRPRQRLRAARHRRRQPRPATQRSILRRPVRGQPDRSLLRQNPPSQAQPRRRPPRQRRRLPHRPDPRTRRPTHPRLPRPAHHTGPHPTRSHPLPQALHRPRDLRAHPTIRPRRTGLTNALTNIGASALPNSPKRSEPGAVPVALRPAVA